MVRQREAEATRRIDRRSDSKALRGYAAGKAKIGVETHKQCIMWICKGQGSKTERWQGKEQLGDGKAKKRDVSAKNCTSYALWSNGKAKTGKV